MCSRDFPCSGSSRRLRMIVGCGPPNPSRGPISTVPSSSRSSTTKSRTSHQNRASTSGSRQPSTSSLTRHAIDETYSQRGKPPGRPRAELLGSQRWEHARDGTGRGEQVRMVLGVLAFPLAKVAEAHRVSEDSHL